MVKNCKKLELLAISLHPLTNDGNSVNARQYTIKSVKKNNRINIYKESGKNKKIVIKECSKNAN